MYVRRKPNRTGTISIQVIDKTLGAYKVVRSFGVGQTEQELVRLEEHTRDFINSQQRFTGELFSDREDTMLSDFVSGQQTESHRLFGTLSGNPIQYRQYLSFFGQALYKKEV